MCFIVPPSLLIFHFVQLQACSIDVCSFTYITTTTKSISLLYFLLKSYLENNIALLSVNMNKFQILKVFQICHLNSFSCEIHSRCIAAVDQKEGLPPKPAEKETSTITGVLVFH